MIAYFPSIYSDELIYSVLARFYNHSGYLSYIYCAEDIFLNSKTRPDMEFVNELKPEIFNFMVGTSNNSLFIKEHTLYNFYSCFLDKEQKTKALSALKFRKGDYNNLLSIPKSKEGKRYLRYCPLCVKKDREAFGETYWHRRHQYMGINVCAKHGCKLINSTLPISGKTSPNLVSAEQEVNIDKVIYADEKERHFAEYVSKAVDADIGDTSVSQIVHMGMMNKGYCSVRGKQMYIKKFVNDFNEFCTDMKNPIYNLEEWKIQKILTGYRFHTIEICLLLSFLNVTVEDMKHITIPEESQQEEFDKKVRFMLASGLGINEIARRLTVSSRTIRQIRDNQFKGYREIYSAKGGPKYDWDKIDNETLPLVKNAIKQINIKNMNGEQPQRITVFKIKRILGLPDKRLEHLKKCMAEINKYKLSQEEYWAQKVIWAIKKINDEGNPLNWKHIRTLTNMRKENLMVCISYLPIEYRTTIEAML